MSKGLRVLADENVGPAVVAGLRQIGWDVRSVAEEALVGASDAAVLGRATATSSRRISRAYSAAAFATSSDSTVPEGCRIPCTSLGAALVTRGDRGLAPRS